MLRPFPNALACAMATARHGQAPLLEQARQRALNEALELGPKKLDGKRKLALLSDPVLLARLHAQLWQQAEQHPLWRHAYQQSAPPQPKHDNQALRLAPVSTISPLVN